MKSTLRRIAKYLPQSYQLKLKRFYYGFQIRAGCFTATEKHYQLLESLVSPGDWVLDIGAHVGHYTAKLSEIVGKEGRVIAFEPVPTTFALLVSNSSHFPFPNVTLLNVAASDQPTISGMEVPKFGRWADYYMAHLSSKHDSDFKVLCTTVDTLRIPHSVSLAKIDAEGYDYSVLLGMKELLERDHPILIVEERSAKIYDLLEDFGYPKEEVLDADNLIFCPRGKKGSLSRIARKDYKAQ